MKHIVIGDIHGRDTWQRVNTKLYEKIIFLGDYVDSYTLSDFTILENLKKILTFKKKNPEKVILLLGNHDVHYLHYPRFGCSGFRTTMQPELSALLRRNADLFQVAYQKDKYLFTHAGVTNSWYGEILRSPKLLEICEEGENLADQLNLLERSTFRGTLYDVGMERGGYGYGGPLWADMKETFTDMLHGYHQIVGHTNVEEIRTVSYTGRSITYADVLTTKDQFHELDI
jgi:predicted phosphodiesterase